MSEQKPGITSPDNLVKVDNVELKEEELQQAAGGIGGGVILKAPPAATEDDIWDIRNNLKI
jgi:hypothetical protein